MDLRIRIRSEGRSLSTLQSTSRRTLSSGNSLIYTLSENGTTLLPVLSQTERILVNSKTKESIFNKLISLFRKQSRREDDFDYLQKNSHLLMEEAGVLKEVEGLDRSQFTTVLPLLALKIPAQETTKCMSVFKNLTFNRPRMKRVFNLEHESQVRLVLLTEGLDMQDFNKDLSSASNLDTSSSSTSKKNPRKRTVTQAIDDTQSSKSVSKPSNEMLEYLSSIGGSVVDMPLQLTYADMNVEEVLSRVLPSDIEVPGSYEQVGHVAHLNLREEQLPYKQLIGQVILDKHYPQLRTVVNKVGQIENEFRTFPMEILSGVDDLDVVVKESNAVFKFNFKDVYWNSRLQMEHLRVITLVQERAKIMMKNMPGHGSSDTVSTEGSLHVADMMAGVGPFAIPIAISATPSQRAEKKKMNKKSNSAGEGNKDSNGSHNKPTSLKIRVDANDLNPRSYDALLENTRTNKIPDTILFNYNQCGRKFIKNIAAQSLLPHEIIMNLPQNATDFLDAMIGLGSIYTHSLNSGAPCKDMNTILMPRVHVYGFSTAEDPVLDLAQRAAESMQCPLSALGYRADGPNGEQSGTTVKRAELINTIGTQNYFYGHTVRDVAPKKLMVCLTFTVPRQVLFTENNEKEKKEE